MLATLSMLLDRRSLSDGRPCPPASWGWPAPVFSPSRRAARSSTRLAGSGRRSCLRFSRGRSFASTGICTAARGRGSCTRCWVSTRCALLAAAIRPSESRSTAARIAAPGQLVDVGGHRLHLNCAGSGTPTVILESGLGETGRLLGMDLDRGRTRHESVRLRPRGSRLERSGFCPAGRCRRGHGPPRPARSRARSGSVCARRPFVGRAVRQDLRRPVSRTGRGNGPARRPTCRSVRGPSELPGLLQWLPPRLCAVAVVGSTWRRAAGLSRRLRQLACAARDMQRLSTRRLGAAACATSSPSCRRRLRRPVRFRASATGRSSS